MAPRSNSSPGEAQPSPSWQAVETLGVAEIVLAILGARKTKSWATTASVSRQQRDDGLVCVWVTLLEDLSASSAGGLADRPGRGELVAAFAARRLGADLATVFGQKDVIILS